MINVREGERERDEEKIIMSELRYNLKCTASNGNSNLETVLCLTVLMYTSEFLCVRMVLCQVLYFEAFGGSRPVMSPFRVRLDDKS